MADRAAKDALYEGFAVVARALASGRRAEIVDLLAQGERPVEQIAGEIGQTVANTSHHLRAMARAGLVTTRREGTRIFYALASDRVADLWSALQQVAAEHAAGHIAGARSVPVSELRRRLRALPAGADVVAYCRGPYCVYADEAVQELTRHGFRARRLADGFPEWKRAGLPVAAMTGARSG